MTKRLSITLIVNILFFSLTSQAQIMKDYKDQWKKIEEAENKGLTQTAKAEAIKVFDAATKENNYPQVIKASMYQIKYRNKVEEDNEVNNLFFIDTLLAKTKAPAKNILYSMQAELLWNYLQQNRWKFYNRTEQVEEIGKDIATWSLAKLHKTISDLYLKSIQNSEILKNTPTKNFDAIIIKGKNTATLRPNLYDFLAHRALGYLGNDEKDVTQPAYKFTIDNPAAFADASTFTKTVFKTKDSASLYFKAVKLYQELISFHLTDNNPEALIDLDIDRLNFMNRHSVISNKSGLYQTQLENIAAKYASNPASAQANYLVAQQLQQELQQNENNEKLKLNNKKAKDICEAVIKKFPNSEGGLNCSNLLKTILTKSLHFKTEQVNLPNQPFRMLIDYKNVEQVYFRFIKTNREQVKKLNNKNDYNDSWQEYLDLKPTKTFTVALPNVGDYLSHSVEYKVEALEKGMYILLASTDEKFTMVNTVMAKDVVYVSTISMIRKGNEFHVLHRNTGQPLANASIQPYEYRYDYNDRKQVEIALSKVTADKNGYFKITPGKDGKNLIFDIKHDNESLFLEENYYAYAEYDENGNRVLNRDRVFLFTDRSIYRPGQTLYFKGIVVNTKEKLFAANVVPNKKAKVILYDANYQKVKTQEYTTNEFGSYSGAFTLPTTGLTGQFYIWDSINQANHYFSVEEYKRPKFSVEIKQPKGTYKINDSIKVVGTAKAYAGNNIDGAKVKYRIVRKMRFPIWWGWDYGYSRGGRGKMAPYNREEMEIANGETITNTKGEFTINFKAIPDESITKESQPTFYYELNADVTDVNGETRSNDISVPVSYQALQLSISMAAKMPLDSLQSIDIKSTNINGEFEAASVSVIMHQLNGSNQFYRTRYWEQPDQFIMNKENYKKDFPYDIYKNENDPKTWDKLKQVLTQSYTTKENDKFKITNTKYQAGFYVIEVTGKDKYGEPVKALHYVELTGNGNNSFIAPVTIATNKTILQPNEKINYSVSSSFDNIFVIHEQQFMFGKQTRTYENISKTAKPFEILVTEADRGGIATSLSFVKYNSLFGDAESFSVPWSNKELKINFETFRDKTLPGSQEEYKVKISGLKGDKVAAELLATMYDASLDQIKPHALSSLNIFPYLYNNYSWDGGSHFNQTTAEERNGYSYNYKSYEKEYDRLGVKNSNGEESIWWENGGYYNGGGRLMKSVPVTAAPTSGEPRAEAMADGGSLENKTFARMKKKDAGDVIEAKKAEETPTPKIDNNAPIQIRKNFNETAFFLPDLKTDAEGNIIIKYTIPEALTQWKLMALTHTKDLATATATSTVVTQKPLMVQPNLPRFVREGDALELAVKIVNLSDKEITGTSQLELINPETNQPVDGWFKNIQPNQYFTIAAGESRPVNFSLEIPFNYNKPLAIRVKALTSSTNGSGASDGEESVVPVVTNRMLVTETMPLPLRGAGTKNFKFDKLLNAKDGGTLSHHALTIEYTSNPAWYAVQALPYLMEYPYDCAEQTFNRYYANALASKIANSLPKIKAIFEKWKTLDTAALKSNLEKNEELKTALLQETPWVMDAKNETQQKKNIALLFDMIKMNTELEKSVKKLKELQSDNGGFVWFKGGPDDRYITQYILTGIGHLKKLNALNDQTKSDINSIVSKALPYLDKRIKEDYDYLIKYKANLKNNNVGYMQIQHLYMRSFFPETKIEAASVKATNYYKEQAAKYWLSNSKYMQALIALGLYRNDNKTVPQAILKSLKENAIVKEEMGMYWKDIVGGYYWHQAPIETMSVMIEAFGEVGKDDKAVDDLKTWLLKNKQTNNWKTTKATADACYALLLQGDDWLSAAPKVDVTVGSTKLSFGEGSDGTEAGTGYSKKRIEGEKVKSEMGNIQVTVVAAQPNTKVATSWGGVYWQYFENLDKITSAETPLKLNKKLFKEVNSDKGKQLLAIKENDKLQVGDKMIVRIELRVDRDMEYIHMKDMRSSGTEPLNVLSQYKWQGGLGYYESTKDASTNFFFHYLPKGTYVFEYPVFVTHKGNFSNGITTIQCMYAPEFTSHSEGVRVKVE
jgi:uncharacterized protein YfaS (alpha-2-macroglobulin family)